MTKRRSLPKVGVLVVKARRAFQSGRFDEANALAAQALAQAKAKKNSLDQAEALSVLSDTLRDSKDTKGAIAAIEKSIAIAQKVGLLYQLCDAVRKRAFLYLVQSEYAKAEEFSRKALRLARDNRFKAHEADALAMIGHLCEVRKERPRALVWFREAMKAAREAKHVWRESGLHHDLGRINGELQNYNVGLDYLDQGERFALKHGFRKHILLMLRAKADIYKAVGDTGKALELYEKSFAPDQKAGTKFEEMENAVRRGAIYLDDGRFDEATEFYRRGMKLAEEFGYGRTFLQNCFGLGLCHIRKNEFLSAYECFSKLLLAVKGDYANNLSTVRSALEQVAFLLRRLDNDALAARVEELEHRFKSLDDEGTYTVPQRSSMREELVKELPDLVESIVHMQFGIYEARGIRVNTRTGEITVDGNVMSEPLKGAELNVFRFLLRNLGQECTLREIHEEYSGGDIDLKSLQHRVQTLIYSIRKKGVSAKVLRPVSKKGYKLIAK